MINNVFPIPIDSYQRNPIIIVGTAATKADYSINENKTSSYPTTEHELLIEATKVIANAFADMTNVMKQRHQHNG